MEIFDLSGKVAMVTGSTVAWARYLPWRWPRPEQIWRYAAGTPRTWNGFPKRSRKLGRDSAGFVLESTSKKVSRKAWTDPEAFRKVDILVNNAGVNHRVPALEFPEEAWDLVINTNLKGYFWWPRPWYRRCWSGATERSSI